MKRISAAGTISFFIALFLSVANTMATDYALHTGLNAYFRTVANSASLTPNKSITMEAWIKPSGPGVIFNEVDAFTISNWDQSLGEVTAQGDVVIGMPGIAGAVAIGRLTFNEWSHVVLRYNATTGVLDGFLNGQKSAGFLVGTRTFPPGSAYMCFGRAAGTKLSSGTWLPADFDEVRIWSVARSDAEITGAWSTRIATTAISLVQNFHLDDGSGTNVTPIVDSSGHQNGVNVNAAWVASTLTLATPPTATTGAPTVINNDTIQLSGTVNPNGSATTYYFQFGNTLSYGNTTLAGTLPAQSSNITVTATLSNLLAGTYNYRLFATNTAGAVVGANASFTITNAAGLAASLTNGNSYLRDNQPTRPFFPDGTVTIEFWFEAQPGVLLNEADAFDVSQWDYNFLEIASDGTLVAGLPGISAFTVQKLNFGTWYHVAFRYDPSTLKLDVFLNGVKAASATGGRNLPWDAGRLVYYTFGRGGPKNLGTGAYYHGKIDEIRIWKIAVPDNTIAANENLILSGKDPNLFGDWSLETVSGEYSPDKSPSNNPIQFVNGVALVPSQAPLIVDQRPTAITGSVQDTLTAGSVLTGSVISLSTNNTAYFVWSDGQSTNITPGVTVGAGTNSVQATLNGLLGGTNYSFALVVSNAFGTMRGATVNFTKLGWAGYALSLFGGSYIRSVNDQHAFFPDETVAFELWIRPHKQGVVIAETDKTSPSLLDSSIVEILGSGSVVAGFPGVPTIVIGKVDTNVWNNIVLRYNKATQVMDGFVNGVKSSASSSGDRVAGWEIGRQVTYTFGKATTDAIGTGESMEAEWDEIRLWNIARSDADILASYNKKLTGTEAGMVAYYRLDEQSASITDASRHNNPAAVIGPFTSLVSGAPLTVAFTPIKANGSTATIQFLGIPGREMQLESTSDFVTWTAGPTVIVDPLGIATFTTPEDAQLEFFRAKQL